MKNTITLKHKFKATAIMLLMFIASNVNAQKSAILTGNWSNPAIWMPAGVPTSADSVIINTAITVTVDVASAQAKAIRVQPSANLRVGGTLSLPAANYVFDSASTVEYFGAAQNIAPAVYGNLLLNGSDVKTATGSIIVKGLFVTNANFKGGNYTHYINRSWVNTASFIADNGTINFNGTTQQSVPGVTYNNLTLSNSQGWLVAAGDITVLDTLATTSIYVLLDLGTNRLIMPADAVVANQGTIRTQNTSTEPIPADKTWGVPPYGTVLYNADNGGQTIAKGTYNNLTVSHLNAATSTANGEIIIGGIINAATANTTINMGEYKLTHQNVGGIGSQNTLGRIRTQNTSLTPLPAGRTWNGTIIYDAPAGGQKIVFGTYNNLVVTTGSTVNTSSSIVVNGNLQTSPTTVINMNQDTLTGSFNASNHQGELRTQAAVAFPAGKTWGGTVTFDASGDASASQTIIVGNYNNLRIPSFKGLNNNVIFQQGTYNIAGDLFFTATVEGTGAFIRTGSGYTFNFNGNGNQNITVSAKHFLTNARIVLDNITISGGGIKTLGFRTTMDGLLNLQSGVLKTTSANLLELNSTATVVAPALGNNTSYVEGPISRKGTTAFTFPVGRDGVYAPLSISAPGTNGEFVAEYFRPQNLSTNKSAPLVQVSDCEYWNLLKVAGANNPTVTLSWTNASACGFTPYILATNNLKVAHWNGSNWVNIGSSAVTGNATAGTITSSPSTLPAFYGAFTLASDLANTLPVEFSSVTAVQTPDGVKINWSVASEVNTNNYVVERSMDGVYFNGIGTVNAKSINGESVSYQYLDAIRLVNAQYYRIKAVDNDGSTRYSIVVKVTPRNQNPANTVTVYPNPIKTNKFDIIGDGLVPGGYTFVIYDANGKIVHTQLTEANAAGLRVTVNLPSNLSNGIYRLLLIGKQQTLGSNLVIQK